MARSQRVKGAAFERLVANALKPLYPNAKRGIGQTRSASEVADVEGTRWWIEAKHRKRISLMAAWSQAAEATDGRPLLVVTRQDRGPIIVSMEMSEFIALAGGTGEGV